jgi:hypothetical protein
MSMKTMVFAVSLAALCACAGQTSKPEEPAAPVAQAAAAVPAPEPKAVAPDPAPAPKPAAPADPAPAPAAPKKRKKIALGLPALSTLKEEVGLTAKQSKAAKAIYDEYKPKLDEAAANVKEATDKKAANKEVAPLRKEVLEKLRDLCADDAQKAKFDELTAPAKKKASTP